MKCIKEDTRFSKVARMQAHKVTTNVLTKRSPRILKNSRQLFFTLTNAYESFTNHFSVNAFIEKLPVMPFKKIKQLI